ncbi:DUF5712 family protein [Cytophagales bacterium LB-30]|uniref:DUF5712 family protein n=1 Tax=Shiella aurantiaca TaxID=3058365 RepID=A0ABT8F987_9BACT|nr:DUF5712 family protein [Shiella aurantiaca]MDN4167041.1 DUF5712 family protein [Shiella aurantiaca]
MNIKITSSETGNNKGSCTKLVDYLEKENKEKALLEKRFFFDEVNDMVSSHVVKESIDANHHKLGRNDAKFFMLVISPSEKELQHIACDEKKLMAYTRKVMDNYAYTFNKGITGTDLLWFAKVEEFRKEKGKKQPKEGLQWHVHVIVSRYDKQKRYKLSPLTNHRNTTSGIARGGFDRNAFRENGERAFDQLFDYKRAFQESWEYQNAMKNGNVVDKYRAKEKLKAMQSPRPVQQIPSQSLIPNVVQVAIKNIGKANKYTSHDEEEEPEKKRNRDRGIGM